MSRPVRRGRWVALAILLVAPAALITYKLTALGYSMADVLPRTRYRLTIAMKLDGHGGDVKVRTFLPVTDERQSISGEQNTSPGLRFVADNDGINRAGHGARVVVEQLLVGDR